MRITTCDRQTYGDLDGGAASSLVSRSADSPLTVLSRVLRGREVDDFERRLIAALEDELFQPREDLRSSEQCQLSYARMRLLREKLQLRAVDLLANPDHLLALHAWTGLTDGTLTTLLTIHFNLCIGSILQQGEGRPELQPLLDELDRMETIGVFLATELAYGNNVQALQTEAVYDHERQEFLLHTPSARAQKFMPNTGAEGIAKLAVVMARMKVDGEDCGVFPFIVRIRTADGLCPGVHVTALGDKPGYALDNAVTSFDHVRVPRAHWLSGADNRIDGNGVFSSAVRSRRTRFLQSMDRVQTGKLCLSAAAVSISSAALQMTLTYAAQRKTFGAAGGEVPLLSYRTYQRVVYEAVATNWACALLVQHTNKVHSAHEGSELANHRLLALCKVFVSSRSLEILTHCRERVGAQGMFTANRIISYLVQSKGIVTAEGDNEVLLVKSARELLLGLDYQLPELVDERMAVPLLESVDYLTGLVTARERSLAVRLRDAIGSAAQRGNLFDVWNEELNEALELAATHAVRLALECFGRALDEIQDTKARHVVELLMRSFALQEISKFSTSLLVDGLIDRDTAGRIGAERVRVTAALALEGDLLTRSFAVPQSILAAPIAGDYLASYDFMDRRSEVHESFIRLLTDHVPSLVVDNKRSA